MKTHLNIEVVASFKHFSDSVVLLLHGLGRIQVGLVWVGDKMLVEVVPEPAPHVREDTGWKLSLEVDDILATGAGFESSIIDLKSF